MSVLHDAKVKNTFIKNEPQHMSQKDENRCHMLWSQG